MQFQCMSMTSEIKQSQGVSIIDHDEDEDDDDDDDEDEDVACVEWRGPRGGHIRSSQAVLCVCVCVLQALVQ
jgi:hypothetical protein